MSRHFCNALRPTKRFQPSPSHSPEESARTSLRPDRSAWHASWSRSDEMDLRGGRVNDRQREIIAAAVGAAAGAIAGYVLFTERGRELRRRMEPALEDFAHELVQLRGTVNRAIGVASEGWHVFNDTMG